VSEAQFVYVTYIHATPERVWQALTDGDFTRRYWGGRRITSDWQPGSPVAHVREDGGSDWQGDVIEAQPPFRLSYTFHMSISTAHHDEAPSRVTFDLEPMGDVVMLTLTHREFSPDSATYETTRQGWPAILSSLKSLLETGEPLPFTRLGFGPSQSHQK
jgi:uncharacterized protein YndB with AHSA1/START domain